MRKKSKQQTADERKLALGLRLSAVYVKRLPHFVLMRQPPLLLFEILRRLTDLKLKRFSISNSRPMHDRLVCCSNLGVDVHSHSSCMRGYLGSEIEHSVSNFLRLSIALVHSICACKHCHSFFVCH